MKKILLTGATGYIGRRLMLRLIGDKEVSLRLFVRNKRKISPEIIKKVEIIEGDTFNKESLDNALQGINTAYYLIHSLGAGKDFAKLDRISAENFRDACIKAGVERIVYLGGLGVKETASEHLLSRIETGEVLSAYPDKIQTVWFRAGVIIGSGGASFEIIRNLVQKLPLMVVPKWVNTKTQPIAVDDVIDYLYYAKDLKANESIVADIGTEEMSFKDMLYRTGKVMGLKRLFVPIPFMTPRLSSYWLVLLTPVSFKIAEALVDGLKSESILQNENSRIYFPNIVPLTYEQSIVRAIEEIEHNQVVSRWCDSSAGKVCDINDDNVSRAVFIDKRVFKFGGTPENVFDTVISIGGKKGWLKYNFLWKLGGYIDKLLRGPGLNRGRRDEKSLRVGDGLDFWKVLDVQPGKRLLLLSEMKLPGKGWLEFSIEDSKLVQKAYFYPNGLLGRVYWYFLLPVHFLIFKGLGKSILEHARVV